MKIRVRPVEGVVEGTVAAQSEEAVEKFLATGEAPVGWILIEQEGSGWPARVNLAGYGVVERSSS